MEQMTLEQQRALALAAARLRAQEAEQPQQRTLGQEALRQLGLTARAGYEAFTAPAAAVLEAGRGLYNIVAPESAQLPSVYQAQSAGLSALGLPQPETMTERAVQAGAQSMAGAGGLARLAPNVPVLSGQLSQQIPAAGVAGLTSQPAAEITKEFTGSDLAAAVAGVGVGALTATGAGKAISAVESGKSPLLTMEQVRQRASQSYNAMDQAGVSIKPVSAKGMVSNIRQSLKQNRMVEGTDEAAAINARLSEIDDMIGTARVDFNKLDSMRQMLNDLRMSRDPAVRRLGSIAVKEVDNYILGLNSKDLIAGQGGLKDAVRNLVSARKDWRNASRAAVLDDALNVAEARALDPKTSESELIRRGFINIASDKKKMDLFSKQEQNIIKSVAKGGNMDTILSMAARFSPLRSQLAAIGTGVAYTQSPITAGVLGGGGLVADVAQGALRQRAAQQAIRRIASGVPAQTPRDFANLGLRTALFGPLEEDNKAGITAP
jgi:hypothetical protein